MVLRLSNVLAWFVYSWLSVILFTDLIRWLLWASFSIPLHYLIKEGTLFSVLSLGIGIIKNNTFAEFFPAMISVWVLCALANYVLVGSPRFLPWRKI